MLVEERPITEIQPYDKNPRRNDDGVEAVAASLQEFGFRQPIVVDEEGVIVVGQRVSKQRQARQSVPVRSVGTGAGAETTATRQPNRDAVELGR